MLGMARPSKDETEVKLAFPSVDEARRAIRALGAEEVAPRVLQDDWLYDRADGELRRSQRALRLRRRPEGAITYKGPQRADAWHKVREEREIAIDDPDEAEAVLFGLGFERSFRYQKYRTQHRLGDLDICLDETPLGCFVELEGDGAEIDRVAARLGFTREDYVRLSYVELHEQEVRAGRRTAGDLVFDDAAKDTSR
jgi:adenylate cyclase class 2